MEPNYEMNGYNGGLLVTTDKRSVGQSVARLLQVIGSYLFVCVTNNIGQVGWG